MDLFIDEFDYDEFDIKHDKKELIDYQTEILKYDDYWYQKNKNNKNFKLTKKRLAKIISKYGISYLKLRYYKNLLTNENICPVKKYLNMEKNKNYVINSFKKEIIKQLELGASYRLIKYNLNNIISLQEISRIMKKTILFVQEKSIIKEKILPNKKLYVNCDETYSTVKENGFKVKYRHRIISLNDGYDLEKTTQKRRVLDNKYTFCISTRTQEKLNKKQFTNILLKETNKRFEFNINNLILCGDGATWIKSTAQYLNTDYVLDKWHPHNKLKQVFIVGKGKRTKENYQKLNYSLNLFDNGKYYELLNYLKLNNADEKIYKYFKNNKIGIINQIADWNIGVSAESDVYHLVKSISNNGAKIYSKEVFNNLLILRKARINKLEVLF